MCLKIAFRKKKFKTHSKSRSSDGQHKITSKQPNWAIDSKSFGPFGGWGRWSWERFDWWRGGWREKSALLSGGRWVNSSSVNANLLSIHLMWIVNTWNWSFPTMSAFVIFLQFNNNFCILFFTRTHFGSRIIILKISYWLLYLKKWYHEQMVSYIYAK